MEKDSNKFREFIKVYWNYYRELENEFIATRRYVDFQKGNFKTYSIEFLKLFQAACSEIDVIGKAFASEFNSNFKHTERTNNILKWWFEIQDNAIYTDNYWDNDDGIELDVVKVRLLDEFELEPWGNFKTEKYRDQKNALRYRTCEGKSTPKWWSDYNKVKHSRAYEIKADSTEINYTKANFENVANAFAGLYILEKAFMEAIGTQSDLEAFVDYSILFEKETNITSIEIDELLNK